MGSTSCSAIESIQDVILCESFVRVSGVSACDSERLYCTFKLSSHASESQTLVYIISDDDFVC